MQRITFFFEKGSFGMRFNVQGLITHVDSGGQAESLGVQVGDVIFAVAGTEINKETLVPQLKALQRPGEWYAVQL
jgi:S1-C subfamily serine protease